MTVRMTLSLDDRTGEYLKKSATATTAGNVSAYVEKLVRNQAVRESVAGYVAWQSIHPDYAENATVEREAAEVDRGAA